MCFFPSNLAFVLFFPQIKTNPLARTFLSQRLLPNSTLWNLTTKTNLNHSPSPNLNLRPSSPNTFSPNSNSKPNSKGPFEPLTSTHLEWQLDCLIVLFMGGSDYKVLARFGIFGLVLKIDLISYWKVHNFLFVVGIFRTQISSSYENLTDWDTYIQLSSSSNEKANYFFYEYDSSISVIVERWYFEPLRLDCCLLVWYLSTVTVY